MKRGVKGQVSVEYMLVLGLAFLIILPGFGVPLAWNRLELSDEGRVLLRDVGEKLRLGRVLDLVGLLACSFRADERSTRRIPGPPGKVILSWP